MKLVNLNQLFKDLQSRFQSEFVVSDYVLPDAFKKEISGNGDYLFDYKKHMVHMSSSSLNGYIPNIWFLIASYFVDYYKEVIKYKEMLCSALMISGIKDKKKRDEILGKYSKLADEKFKSLDKKNRNIESYHRCQNEAAIEVKNLVEPILNNVEIEMADDDRKYLIEFVSDYRWWGGGKTIDRGDFYVSPILDMANVVNASHSYIAELCKFLSGHPAAAIMLRYPNALIVKDTLPDYFKLVFSYLYQNEDKLESIFEHVVPGSKGSVRYAYDFNGERQTNFFIKGKENFEAARKGDFFELPFEYKGEQYFLSLELAKERNTNKEVSFYGLKPIIEANYPSYNLIEDSGCYVFICNKNMKMFNSPLQQIFYGAPGTGKSNAIKREVEDKGQIHFRTTFHPDSDYSTFVGCYKPTMNKVKKTVIIGQDEKEVKPLAGCSDSENQISYQFVPQAFTKAYCEAWNNYTGDNVKPVFLIIEEINRGNCAQIFGDIFQLLDRETEGDRIGFSTYPIDADEDLKKFLLDGRKEDGASWLENKKGIESNKLCLPPNLYIWATMNTSDQSLFPIDSAFKRRWDWKYMKIIQGKDKESGQLLEWTIDVKVKGSDENAAEFEPKWWDFVQKINEVITDMTNSADKQLGYFFCKAKDNKVSVDTFVNKVCFYLWNDVFKDFAMDGDPLLQYEQDKKVKDLTFPEFFMEDGESINVNRVSEFIGKVLKWEKKSDKDNKE